MDGSETMAVAEYTDVCAIEDIPPLGARVVRRPRNGEDDVAVFRGEGDRVFALADRCPHKGGPLSQGIVFGDRVACPLHNWTIELDTGCAAAPDEGCARRYQVRVHAGRVLVAFDGA
jgi:nitrite reductase (NADH) small subunit